MKNFSIKLDLYNLPDTIRESDVQYWVHETLIRNLGPWPQIQIAAYLPEEFEYVGD